MSSIVNLQRAFFLTGETRSYDFRKQKLQQLRALIVKNEVEITKALNRDLAKSTVEGYLTEIAFTIQEIDFALKNLKKWMSLEKFFLPFPLLPGSSEVRKEPYGVSLIIGPWNYPFQLLISPLVGSIAAGNTAVLKPSELAPHTEKLIEEMINVNFPPNYLHVLKGGAEETQVLLKDKWDFIFYTGSTAVGKLVMKAAAENLTPVCLELGGKSPCIVDRQIDLTVAARRIIWGKMMNVGQTCIAPDFLVVHEDVRLALITELKKCLRLFYGENPKTTEFYGRIINQKHFKRLVGLLDGVNVLHGGDSDLRNLYIEPTLVECNWDHPAMQEEIFGPILPIFGFQDIEEVIGRLNRRPHSLALYVFSNNKILIDRVLSEISFGGGCVNDCNLHFGSPHLPFGGIGASGMGSYHGQHSFDLFSHKKSVVRKPLQFDFSLRYPPYDNKKFKILKRLV